jgi:hypothetical protein
MIVLGDYSTPQDEIWISRKRTRQLCTMHAPLMGHRGAFGREEAARESVGMVSKPCMTLWIMLRNARKVKFFSFRNGLQFFSDYTLAAGYPDHG